MASAKAVKDAREAAAAERKKTAKGPALTPPAPAAPQGPVKMTMKLALELPVEERPTAPAKVRRGRMALYTHRG